MHMAPIGPVRCRWNSSTPKRLSIAQASGDLTRRAACRVQLFSGKALRPGWRITGIVLRPARREATVRWLQSPGTPGTTGGLAEIAHHVSSTNVDIYQVNLEGPVGADWRDAFMN